MAADNGSSATWELSSYQRNLADYCFEESQYETAIATLGQLRASEFSPWPPHLRQLIYISLQSTEESPKKDELEASIHVSPSKIIKQQQLQMNSNHIPVKAVVNAQRVLMAYLHASSPNALSRALPQRKSPLVPGIDYNEGDSTVARRAAYITQFRDCWELLSNDFSSRQSAAPSTPKARSKTKRYSERIGGGIIDTIGTESTSRLAVQENAWPLLEWLVTLFERDEILSTLAVRCSQLLVDQLLDHDGKAHFETPISIIAQCFEQSQLQRRRLASRLLSLLVNSTTIVDLDLNAFIVAIYTRVPSLDQLSQLLSQLGNSTTIQILKFKIGLCQRLISGLGLSIGSNAPKPQPRIRPRPGKLSEKDSRADPQPTAKSSIPSTSEILRLAQTPIPDKPMENDPSTPLWCKFQLLLAFGTLQIRMGANGRDSEWMEAIVETLPQVVREVFEQKGTEASMYQRLLENQIVGWKQGMGATL